MKNSLTVLVSAIGSFSADCVVKTLKNNGYKVLGCDIYPSQWHAISKECDTVYQAPFATNEKEYIDFLLEVSQKESIDYIIPLTDLEIDVINRNRDAFKEAGVTVLIQSENCLKIARNKFAMYELFKDDENVILPYSVSSENLDMSFPLPAVAKPVDGRSSEGLMRITNLDQLSNVATLSNYIVQEMIPGSVFTVDYVRDQQGNDFAVPREELLRTKNGAGTTVRVVNDANLNSIVSYIGNKLDITGCINMEFIFNKDKYYLIDINPRFSAGVAFSNFVGFDMVTSHMNAFLGKTINPKVDLKEQIITKRYKEELLWKS